MKFLGMFLIVLTMFISCNKQELCDNASSATNSISITLAVRWNCDNAKIYADLIKPISGICPQKLEKTLLAGTVCSLVVNYLTSLGADALAKRWSCDKNKVQADLGYASKLCELF